MRGSSIMVLVASAILLCATAAQGGMYTLVDLGTYGQQSSYGFSVNDDRQVVGSAGGHAVLFDTTGGGNSIYLGDAPAQAINNSGQIVGGSGLATLFDPTGGGANVTLGPGYAYDISNTGHTVGWMDVSGHSHATLFQQMADHVGVIDLGTLAGGYYMSSARSINDSGQIVGYAQATGRSRPVLFDFSGSGNNVDLGTLGGVSGSARSINNLGQIVGIASTESGGSHATLFDATGGGANLDLGTLGGNSSAANAISDMGYVVGQAQDGVGSVHACLFDVTGSGNNIDLNTLIDPTHGWTLQAAMDINNSGWIVGFGSAPGTSPGVERAFLLIPEAEPVPVPGAALLGILGLGLSGYRLRRIT